MNWVVLQHGWTWLGSLLGHLEAGLSVMVLLRWFISAYCGISSSRRSSFVVAQMVDHQIPRGEERHESPLIAQAHLVKCCFHYVLISRSFYNARPDFRNGGLNFSPLKGELHGNRIPMWGGIYSYFHSIPYHYAVFLQQLLSHSMSTKLDWF